MKFTLFIFVTLICLGLILRIECLDVLAQVECEDDPEGYIVPDPLYCDRFMECSAGGRKLIKICELGEKFDYDTAGCVDEELVECQGRSKSWRLDHGNKKLRILGPDGAHHDDDDDEEDGHGEEHESMLQQVFSGINSRLNVFGASDSRRTSTVSTTTPTLETTTTTFEERPDGLSIPFDPLADIPCDGDDVYVVPDPSHCDRYLHCPSKEIELCEEGLLLDTNTGFCEVEDDVDCGDRKLNMRENQRELERRLEEKIRELTGQKPGTLSSSANAPSASSSQSSRGSSSVPESSSTLRASPVSPQKPFPTPFSPSAAAFLPPRSSQVPKSSSVVSQQQPSAKATPVPKPSSFPFTFSASERLKATLLNPRPSVSNPATRTVTAGVQVVGNPFNVQRSTVAEVSEVPLSEYECREAGADYSVGDRDQCDQYARCSQGVKTLQLCSDGLAFSLEKSQCDYLNKVDCSARPELQPAQSSDLCPRQNGFFPVPAEQSCSQYVDCREGQGHVLSCGAGAVFDEDLGCVHPDQTSRPGCSAAERYQFECPTFGLHQRFGDHDRLPHPTDCALFFACLRNGAPRLLGCQQPTVFNPETGFCEHQSQVPGCQGYYPEEEDTNEDREALAQRIRQQILKEFNLSQR